MPEPTSAFVRRFLICCLGLLLSLAPTAQGAEAEQVYHVGITAFRDKAATLRQWQPTMDYLGAQVPGAKFVAVPMALPEFEGTLAKGDTEFLITNPEQYAALDVLYGVNLLATLVSKEVNGKQVRQFGGVIFTRRDRTDIQRLEDLKGKTIASTFKDSFAAYLLQDDLLKQHGIDVDRDCKLLFLGVPQDLAVKAVETGRADIGFVRTGILETMAAEGRIDLARFRVLNATAAGGFPFLLSTRLYPEWAFSAAPGVPLDITNRVAAALLLMKPDSPAARSGTYYRWSAPLGYTPVENLMRQHRIYPFNKPSPIRFGDVLRQYAIFILAALTLFSLILATLYLRANKLNTELQRSRQTLKDMAHHDALTGLANRNLLDDHLSLALAQARRTGAEVAVCLIDLDGFKPVNDTLGHKVGDEVLQEVARRLKGTVREVDTVARWGGDEFVLLLSGATEHSPLAEIMERVLDVIAQDYACCPDTKISASIGVSLFPADADGELALFRHADAAMYRAKKAGGNRYCIYYPPEDGG